LHAIDPEVVLAGRRALGIYEPKCVKETSIFGPELDEWDRVEIDARLPGFKNSAAGSLPGPESACCQAEVAILPKLSESRRHKPLGSLDGSLYKFQRPCAEREIDAFCRAEKICYYRKPRAFDV